MKTIDFEAHFFSQHYLDSMYARRQSPRFEQKTETQARKLWHREDLSQPYTDELLGDLMELEEGRLARLDKHGIDVQILSLSAPGIEQLEPETGTQWARQANDDLAGIIRRYPDRYMGYAALAPNEPEKAADELERTVTELGFVGWNTHSNYNGSYIDDKRYWPILARAEKLGVPIYLHPTIPAIEQLRTYGFALSGAGFGFGVDTTITLMRLIFSGALDQYPDLKIILGHLGEGLPFLMKRIDWAYVRPFDPKSKPALELKPGEYLHRNVFVTTSGNYFEPAFKCTMEAMGIDKILLGTDYPYEPPEDCMDFIESMNLDEADKEKIYYRNAANLIKVG